jgi:lipopolysaccharide transport system permease protein
MPMAPTAPNPIVIIRPSLGHLRLNLAEIWHYRELLYFFVWRDIKVRYKQTALGVAWAVIQPVMTMLVFSIFFGKLAKMPSDNVPYPVFAFAALLPWQLFAFSLSEASNSILTNQNLITKVYFPRLIIPVAATLAGLVDFAIAFAVLLGLMVWYQLIPRSTLLLAPLFILLAVTTALSVGLWLSALNVKYRDVRYTIPFLTQLWMFATPVAYPSSLVPEPWRTFYGLNPMAGVVEGFRWMLLGTGSRPGAMLAVSVVAVIVLFIAGLWYFRKMEATFADIV